MVELPGFKDVLNFWFGRFDENGNVEPSIISQWWSSTKAFDDEIRVKYLDLHQAIMSGDKTEWLDSADSALAYLIVLDQFSRNMFRGTEEAFRSDAVAILAAKHCVNQGYINQLPAICAVFMIMPFTHSEDVDDQRMSLQLFGNLESLTQGEQKSIVSSCVTSAKKHADIIMKYGRYPHRNMSMGRDSTPEELHYLSSGGARFGQ